MAHANKIDDDFPRIRHNGAGTSTHGGTMIGQDENQSPFLRLPGELRNMIYCFLFSICEDGFSIDDHSESLQGHHWERLQSQPAITRVSRQLRAEALSLYNKNPKSLRIHAAKTSQEWVRSIEGVVHAFAGKSGCTGNSPLRHVTGLYVELLVKHGWGPIFTIEMMSDPEYTTLSLNCVDALGVKVGSPDMNWADAKAVRAAGKDAATGLEKQWNLLRWDLQEGKRPDLIYMGDELVSNPADHRAAVDVMRVLASACPQLTTVYITDWFNA